MIPDAYKIDLRTLCKPRARARRSPHILNLQNDTSPVQLAENFGARRRSFSHSSRAIAFVLVAILVAGPLGTVTAEETVSENTQTDTVSENAFSEAPEAPSSTHEGEGSSDAVVPEEDSEVDESDELPQDEGAEESVGDSTEEQPEELSEDQSAEGEQAALPEGTEDAGTASSTPGMGSTEEDDTQEAIDGGATSTATTTTPTVTPEEGESESNTTQEPEDAFGLAYAEAYEEAQYLFQSQIDDYEAILEEQDKLIEELRAGTRPSVSEEELLEKALSKCFQMDGGAVFCPGASVMEYSVGIRGNSTGVFKVFSTKSERGNFEIYVQSNNRVSQITENERDDVLPRWDALTNAIVWQGQEDGRWQIFIHERAKGTTRPLTDGSTNSINPDIQAGIVVWQQWVDGRWEIFSATHSAENGEWEVRRITENETHDINPSIAGGFITWQSQTLDGWQIRAYNILSGETFDVSQAVGKNKNPRVAIIWESEENGKSTTLSYGIASGMVSAVGGSGGQGGGSLPEIPSLPSKESEAIVATSTVLVAPKDIDTDDNDDDDEPSVEDGQ